MGVASDITKGPNLIPKSLILLCPPPPPALAMFNELWVQEHIVDVSIGAGLHNPGFCLDMVFLPEN